MQKKHVLILGAGISGLSLAWYLSKDFQVTVLEKEASTGGWLGSDATSGLLFEKGPRALRGAAFRQLAEELGLKEEIISSVSKKRWLWNENQLRPFPFKKDLLLALLKEWWVPSSQEEETIAHFALRRFNSRLADLLFDPMTLGIYAGDIHTLSVNACFPKLKEWEREYGSLTKALLKNLKSLSPGSLFSFKNGTQTLIDTITEKLGGIIHTGQRARAIHFHSDYVEVMTDSSRFQADIVVSALPARALGSLLHDQELLNFPMQSLHVVNLGYAEEVLPCSGFGYLVPSIEKEMILGVVFDSKIFPQQNLQAKETRLTVMMRENPEPLKTALQALSRHLGIRQAPCVHRVVYAHDAIPQYEMGHLDKVNLIKKKCEKLPQFRLLGNYLSGVSVNDCIESAKTLASDLIQSVNTSKSSLRCSSEC